MPSPPGSRVPALDLLRGLAVLVMIETHALVLLEPGLREGTLFRWVVRLDGLVAPAFLLAAGFSLALVQVRELGALAQASRSLLRILEVLGAASVVNAAWFPVLEAPRYLLRVDILHCVGLSLLLLWPVAVGLARRPRALRWASLALGLALFAVAPLAAKVGGAWSLLLNTRPGVLDASTGAVFPLLPWAGYVFLGASLGSFGASVEGASARGGWRLGLVTAGLLAWTLASDVAQRVTMVLLVLGGLERLAARVPPAHPALRVLRWFSQASLPAYVFHQLLLYEAHVGVFTRYFKERADVPQYLGLLAALVAATAAATLAWRALVGLLTSAARPRPAS
jgi:uncharacterized membrane protein